MRSILKYFLVVLFVTAIDQGTKLWVHAHMTMGPDGQIHLWKDFFKITYVLNYGMAFGLQLGFKYGKLLVTFIRMVASGWIAVHIVQAASKKSLPAAWMWGWALVLGGAIGNTIDSIFYGVWLRNAPHGAPMQWFHGQVIDMIHFDLWTGLLPAWMPIWGGEEVCFPAIFNVADAAIFVGLGLVFYSLKGLDAASATQTN